MPKVDTQKLELARSRKGWTRLDLAALIKVDVSTISNIERGKTQNPKTIKKIADALGLRMKDVFIDDSEAVTQ
jgi:DNA-binding XRE family transcriptional regulator